jgi:hypothetical protein
MLVIGFGETTAVVFHQPTIRRPVWPRRWIWRLAAQVHRPSRELANLDAMRDWPKLLSGSEHSDSCGKSLHSS